MSQSISFVVAARNDNYGGQFLHRIQNFTNVLFYLSKKHNIKLELVIVEWNPPADKPRLKDAIKWPQSLHSGAVRIVEVPNDLHRTFENSNKIPVFEYLAKNVGVRRASGDYVLSTNPDIMFSDKMMEYLGHGDLAEKCFYRADRYDVKIKIPENLETEQQLKLCQKSIYQVHKSFGTQPIGMVEWTKAWIGQNTSRLSPKRLKKGLIRRGKAILSLNDETKPEWPQLPPAYTNMSGDFFMMAAKQWLKLKGYPELKTHSHIDSYLCYLAAFSGMEQTILPYPMYHQEHHRGEHRGRPLTVLFEVPSFKEMVVTGQPRNPNDENWGLHGVDLPVFEYP